MSIFLYALKNDCHEFAQLLKEGGYPDLDLCWDAKEVKTKLALDEKLSVQNGYRADLFILDISAEREAINLCKQIKEQDIYREIPVIVLSTSGAAETFQMAFAYGANDFIVKPVRGYELLTRVRSALKMKHEIDQRKARERELVEVSRQLSDLNTVLNRLSLIDGLTGIPNRRCFEQALDQELRLSLRHDRAFALLLIDIDYFKLYNDAYGHQAGDHCLKAVAQAFTSCLQRPGDLITRFGGEEFAAILPDTKLEGALFVAEKVQAAIAALAIPHGQSKVSAWVSISQGVATFQAKTHMTKEQLIEAADQALYEAKQAGRNCLRPSRTLLLPPK